MKSIWVHLKEHPYQIVINYGWSGRLGKLLKGLKVGVDAILITNPHIRSLYGTIVKAELEHAGFGVRCIEIPDSEESKSNEVVYKVISNIALSDRAKQLFIIAFGGGVVGDVAGYIAAIYKRGIPYIQIPTTLLSQVDSSIGGKVGIDLPYGKNLIGAFYQPKLVFTNLKLLRTLSLRHIRAGLAEVIKYGIIQDFHLFSYVERHYRKILKLNSRSIEYIVGRSAEIKAKIVECDERDTKGKRAILNYGHTLGHAIEAATGYSDDYHHGEAVGIGMICAAEIAEALGMISRTTVNRIDSLIATVGLPTKIHGLKISSILEAQAYDKKFIHGVNRYVLPIRIGRVVIREGVPIKIIGKVLQRRIG